ncbi:hypothetical protein H2200_013375 [Cladophialophora chaetospira]|uniref:RING-type domain-containing protein n=1 Tax=Cladophialophora chaetospira TaxID=386627 RepID=A0AA39CBF0_9EURO|nr:hypothetical protein H2200_013375 [Cladophialophora chaetospira]
MNQIHQLREFRRRLEHFMTLELRHCPPQRQREAVRNFALSLPALTLDQRHSLDWMFYDCMKQLLRGVTVVSELCRLFFKSLPAPRGFPLTRWRSRIKNFATKGLSGLREAEHISIAIGRFLKSGGRHGLSSLPYELREWILFEVMWFLPASPYRALTLSLMESHVYESTESISEDIDHPGSIDHGYFGNRPEDDLYGTSGAPVHIFPPWHSLPDLFEFATIDCFPRRLNPIPSYKTPAESHATSRIQNWAADLHTLEDALGQKRSVIMQLTGTMVAWYDPMRGTIGQLLTTDDMKGDRAPQIPGDLTLQQVSHLTEKLHAVEEHLGQCIQRLLRAETYVHAQEELLCAGDQKFVACASDYARCKMQKDLEGIVAEMKTPHMRQTIIPSVGQHGSMNRKGLPYETESPCPICHEWFGKDETVPPIVTNRCCRRPFHFDCLFDWLKEKFLDRGDGEPEGSDEEEADDEGEDGAEDVGAGDDGGEGGEGDEQEYDDEQQGGTMRCPWCRTEIDMEYFRGLFSQRLGS